LLPTGTKFDVPATQFTYAFNGLDSGVTYSVQVAAKSANGTGVATQSAGFLMAGVPSAPGSVTAAASGSSVTLTWTAATAKGSPITGYSFSGATVADVGPSVSTVTITGLTIGQTYTFGVRALSAAGPGPVTNSAPVTIANPVPDAPSGVTAQPGEGQVIVSWTAPAGNATTVASYVVTGSDGASATINAPSTSATLVAVNGTAVTYSVVAVGANGINSAASAASASVTPSGAPIAPDITLTAAATSITVAFPFPTASNGTTIASVVVSINGTEYPVTASPYVATGLTQGTLYNVILRVTGANGKSSSKTGSITTTSPPGALTGLTSSRPFNSTIATLRWNASTGATSYRITVDGVVTGTVSATTFRLPVPIDSLLSVTVTPINSDGLEGPSANIVVEGPSELCGGNTGQICK
jgi:large repetitive protein